MDVLVSIVITTFNRADFIERAIHSCFNQTYKNIEVIVVDDGSTDNTKDLLKDYCSSGAIYYYVTENKERNAARNFGAYVSKGKYIKFLDSDDTIEPAYIETCISFFQTNPRIEILFTNISVCLPDRKSHKKTGILKNKNLIDSLWYKNEFAFSSVIIKRETFFITKGFDEDRTLIGAEDWEYWMRLSYAGIGFGLVPEFLTNIFIHDSNTMNSVEKIISGKRRALQVLEKKIDKIEKKSVRKFESGLFFLKACYAYESYNKWNAFLLLCQAIKINPVIIIKNPTILMIGKLILPNFIVKYVIRKRDKSNNLNSNQSTYNYSI